MWTTRGRARIGALLIAAGVAFTNGSPASGQGNAASLVIRVEGPISRSIPTGKPLQSNQSFQLGPTDQVTVLSSRGVRVLQGPGLLEGENYTPQEPAKTETGRTRLLGSRGWDFPPNSEKQIPSATTAHSEARESTEASRPNSEPDR
jgi:hypothetical protein